MSQLISLLVVALAAFALYRRVEVRLVLLLAALLLGIIAGQVTTVVQAFLQACADERFVVPICCAMGFAHVLKLTECDRHLVLVLTQPLRRVRPLLVPGTILAGVLVNIPIISQTSTALTLGAVLVPVMRAVGVPLPTIGAALLLGSSIGGELLNPGAPELATVSKVVTEKFGRPVQPAECVAVIFPLLVLHVIVAMAVFSWRSRVSLSLTAQQASLPTTGNGPPAAVGEPMEKPNWIKAHVPLVPLALLFVTGPPLYWWPVPKEWLVAPGETGAFGARLIGVAMLVGVAAAAMTSRAKAGQTMSAFFEGAGYAYTHIISLIVAGTSFGKSVEVTGLAAELGEIVTRFPSLLLPAAVLLPCGFAVLSGSGIGATNSLYGFFIAPCQSLNVDPVLVGALVSLGSAAGRTMSAVAAVALMSASLTETTSFILVRQVALPLLAGLAVVVTVVALGWLP